MKRVYENGVDETLANKPQILCGSLLHFLKSLTSRVHWPYNILAHSHHKKYQTAPNGGTCSRVTLGARQKLWSWEIRKCQVTAALIKMAWPLNANTVLDPIMDKKKADKKKKQNRTLGTTARFEYGTQRWANGKVNVAVVATGFCCFATNSPARPCSTGLEIPALHKQRQEYGEVTTSLCYIATPVWKRHTHAHSHFRNCFKP